MLNVVMLMLAVALDCESGDVLMNPPVEPEAAYGTGEHAVDPSRDVKPAPEPGRIEMRCVNPLRSQTGTQVEQAPYRPHVKPAPSPAPEPPPTPPKPSQRLKLK